MNNFGLNDSGKREEFPSGMVRDTHDDKPRPDLESPFFRERLGYVFARGMKKYGERNWEKGAPFSRFLASAERHLNQWKKGERDEDHLAQAVWNLHAIIHLEETHPELNDLPVYKDLVICQTKDSEYHERKID